MEQIETLGTFVNHLAGIVPVGGQPLEFKMPWHDALMPIAPDYLAVERAVYQCALAGCTTIWIVSHVGTQPLLRKRLGDSIRMPDLKLSERNEKSKYEVDKSRSASIFYVPIHPKDRDKRDSLSWSVLYGANSSYRLCKFISRWVVPDKFFCCFPYGITDDSVIKNNKRLFLSHDNVILSFQGQTVKDGKYYHFTFKADEFKKCRAYTRFYIFNQQDDKTKKIKPTEYRKAADITPDIAFSELDLQKYSVIECPWFYDISTWKGYKTFIGSDIELTIDRKLFRHDIREKLGGF